MNERTDADVAAADAAWARARDEIGLLAPKRISPSAELAFRLGWESSRAYYMRDIKHLQEALKDSARWLRRAMTLAQGNEKLYKQFREATKRARDAHKKEVSGDANQAGDNLA